MDKIKLSEAEWKLMNQLWEEPHLTITKLTERLKEDTGWDKHTIITMLGRLEKKGAVSYRQQGRAKEFYPLVSREKASEAETQSFLNRVYQGSLGLMLCQMMKRDQLTSEERQELRRMLSEMEKGE